MTPESLAASTAKPRSGWAEQVAIGIRRDHRVDCPRSKDRRPRTGRCKCPYSWWQPQVAGAPRVRARTYGNFREAQTLKIQQEVAAHVRRVEIEDAVRTGRNEVVTVYSHSLDWLRRGRKRWEETTFVGREGTYRRQLHSTFGAIPIKDVTVEMVEAWINQRVTEVGYASARGGYYCLTGSYSGRLEGS